MLYLLTTNVIFSPVKMLLFYNVQTTNLIFVDRKTKYRIKKKIIALRDSK